VEVTIELRSAAEALAVCGAGDRHLRRLQDRLAVRVVARDRTLKLSGASAPVQSADSAIRRMLGIVRDGQELSEATVDEVLSAELASAPVPVPPDSRMPLPAGRKAKPFTRGQADYLTLMDDNDIVFVTGPAGTGKTFLAVLKAVELLKAGSGS
jgi:phosphate starvation-inducible PhoH-like protein